MKDDRYGLSDLIKQTNEAWLNTVRFQLEMERRYRESREFNEGRMFNENKVTMKSKERLLQEVVDMDDTFVIVKDSPFWNRIIRAMEEYVTQVQLHNTDTNRLINETVGFLNENIEIAEQNISRGENEEFNRILRNRLILKKDALVNIQKEIRYDAGEKLNDIHVSYHEVKTKLPAEKEPANHHKEELTSMLLRVQTKRDAAWALWMNGIDITLNERAYNQFNVQHNILLELAHNIEAAIVGDDCEEKTDTSGIWDNGKRYTIEEVNAFVESMREEEAFRKRVEENAKVHGDSLGNFDASTTDTVIINDPLGAYWDFLNITDEPPKKKKQKKGKK